jgi:hypothetical protein
MLNSVYICAIIDVVHIPQHTSQSAMSERRLFGYMNTEQPLMCIHIIDQTVGL